MDANLRFSPADKTIWLWKLIISIITIGVYSIYYYFTNNLDNSFNIAITFFMNIALSVVGKINFKHIVGIPIGLFVGSILAIFIIAIPINYLLKFIFIIGIFTLGIQTFSDQKYKITAFSNWISAIWQFILIWLGLYIAQHVQILWI
jgi:hypothetical protein